MSFRKNLEPEDVLISSFQVHKSFTFTEADSGSGVYAVNLVKGTDSNSYNYDLSSADSSSFGTGSEDSPKTRTFFHVPLYHSINKLYYKDIDNIRGYVDYFRGVPTSSDAIVNYTSTRNLYDTNLPLRRPHTRQLKNNAVLITIPQKFYGEHIKPTSIKLTDNSTSETFILRDDGYGNLYDAAYSSSYASRAPDTNHSGSLVGNVFYNDGVIVITETGSYSTVGTGTGSDGFSLKLESSQTIYEREYVCKVTEEEFQHTTNRSLKVDYSGSVAFSGSAFSSSFSNTVHDGFPYDIIGYATSSYKTSREYEIGTKLIGESTHSEFATYVSTIGLYNDQNELLAVGKTAKPIKNDKELALTFVVRFDTN